MRGRKNSNEFLPFTQSFWVSPLCIHCGNQKISWRYNSPDAVVCRSIIPINCESFRSTLLDTRRASTRTDRRNSREKEEEERWWTDSESPSSFKNVPLTFSLLPREKFLSQIYTWNRWKVRPQPCGLVIFVPSDSRITANVAIFHLIFKHLRNLTISPI